MFNKTIKVINSSQIKIMQVVMCSRKEVFKIM